MAIHWKRCKGVALGGVLGALTLTGCGGAFCPSPSPFEVAASYRTANDSEGRSYYRDPLNTWIDHRRMTEFLRKTVTADGVQGLVSKYQFQCTPLAAETGCADCRTCARTIAVQTNTIWVLRTVCVDDGEVLVQASVGPGRTVRAMTYWRKQEQAR